MVEIHLLWIPFLRTPDKAPGPCQHDQINGLAKAPGDPGGRQASALSQAWGMYRGNRGRASWTGCPGLVFRKPLLGKAEDFTVYIKNFIRFPKFNFSKYVGLGYWGSGGCLLVTVHGAVCLVYGCM